MTNPASTFDLETRWRTLSDAEKVTAGALLDDAWAMLTARRPTLESDMTTGTVTTANVTRVLCAMVLRVLKNPSGYSSETIDDWTGVRSDIASTGELHITPTELADITPGRRGQRSLRMVANGDA